MVAMRHLGAFVILLLLPSVVAAGQTAPRTEKERQTAERVTLSFAQKLVEQWTHAVLTHTAGTLDEPVKTIAQRPPTTLHRGAAAGVSHAERLHRTLMFGLSLHTDIAIVELAAIPPHRQARTRSSWSTARRPATSRCSAHWPIARQIAAELARPARVWPAEGPRVAAWYRATVAIMP